MSHSPPSVPTPSRSRLLHDHAQLEGLFEHVLAAFRANDRREVNEVWMDFERIVLAHMECEERTTFPAYGLADPEEVERLLAQHATLRRTFSELAIGSELHLLRLDDAERFVEALRTHMQLEKKLMYRSAVDE